MAAASTFCFLCKTGLVTRTQKAKKKLIFGHAASKYRGALDDLGEAESCVKLSLKTREIRHTYARDAAIA